MVVIVKQVPLEDEYEKGRVTPEDVRLLREWVTSQPHLPGEYITDLDLILAYTSSNGSSEVSKQLIDTHFTLKTILNDLFKERVVDASIEKVLNTLLLQPLPKPTREGYAVFYLRYMDLDPQSFVMVDILRTIVMSWELWQYEAGSWPGFVMACDLEGFSVGHFSRFNLASLQHFVCFLQEAFLAQLKQVHILNAPSFFDRILSMCRPFVKKSILSLLHIHTVGSNTLEQYYPIEALPKESGGAWKSVFDCKDDVIAKMKAGQEFFDADNKKRVVEAKRPGKAKTITDFFEGVEGTFKQLAID